MLMQSGIHIKFKDTFLCIKFCNLSFFWPNDRSQGSIVPTIILEYLKPTTKYSVKKTIYESETNSTI